MNRSGTKIYNSEWIVTSRILVQRVVSRHVLYHTPATDSISAVPGTSLSPKRSRTLPSPLGMAWSIQCSMFGTTDMQPSKVQWKKWPQPLVRQSSESVPQRSPAEALQNGKGMGSKHVKIRTKRWSRFVRFDHLDVDLMYMMDNEWNIDQSFHFMEHQRHFLDSADSQRTGLRAHKPPKKHGLGVRHLWPTPKATLRRSHLLRSWQSKTRQQEAASSTSRFDCQTKKDSKRKKGVKKSIPRRSQWSDKSDSGKASEHGTLFVDALACQLWSGLASGWFLVRRHPERFLPRRNTSVFNHPSPPVPNLSLPKPFLSVPTHAHSLAHSKCRCYRPKLLPLSGIQRHFESAAVATWTWKPWRVPQTSTDGGFSTLKLRWRQTIHVARWMFQHLQTFSTSQGFTTTRSI